MGIFDEASDDSDIISWRCGECGNNTAKKTGRWVDGDGTPANEYTPKEQFLNYTSARKHHVH